MLRKTIVYFSKALIKSSAIATTTLYPLNLNEAIVVAKSAYADMISMLAGGYPSFAKNIYSINHESA